MNPQIIHTANFVSDAARSNAFYQELFGLRIQAHQGPTAPVLGVGGVQFLMFAGGGRGAAPRPASINHLCMNMEKFNPETVVKALESYGIKARASAQGAPGPLVRYISMRMENRGTISRLRHKRDAACSHRRARLEIRFVHRVPRARGRE